MSQTILVEDFMTPSPHSIGVSLSVADAKKLMKKFKIRHLPVLDRGELVGVVSERDVQMIESISNEDAKDIGIEQAMSQGPYTVARTTPLETAARHMAKHKLGSAVVVDTNRVVGVLTTTDGMRALAELLSSSPRS